MQLSASSLSSNPLAALLGASAQTPAAPAGGAGEFSQLVAELSALPPGTASDVAVVVPQVAPLPAGAMWQSLYSTSAPGGDGKGSVGPAVAGQQESANTPLPQTDSNPSAPVNPGSNRRKILGSGRGSRMDARPVVPLERARKGLADQPVAGCSVNSDSAEGIAVLVAGPRGAEEMIGLGQDSPARGFDLLPASEVATPSTPMPVQVPDAIQLAAGVSGRVESESQGIDGEQVQLGEPQGRSTSRNVSSLPIAARGTGKAGLALSSPVRAGESRVAPLSAGMPASADGSIGGADGGIAASSSDLNRGSENALPRAKSLPLTSRAGMGNERVEFGPLTLKNLGGSMAQFRDPASLTGGPGASTGEPGNLSTPNSEPEGAVPWINSVHGVRLAESAVGREEPGLESPDAGTVSPVSNQNPGFSMNESEGVSSEQPVRALPSDSRQALRSGADALAEMPGRAESSILPGDRVGTGPWTASQFDWANLPPPVDARAAVENISPETLGTAQAAMGETQAQAVVAALGRPGEKVQKEQAVTGEDENAPDDRDSNSLRVTRDSKGEKSAARGEEEIMRRGAPLSSHRKNFQKTTEEQHAAGTSAVGIGTANSPVSMTPSAFAPRSEAANPAALAATLPTGQMVEFGTSEWQETAEPAEVAGTAQQAVTAVLDSVERAAGREQHSVSLKFDLGDTPLRVRVEMRAEEVRATFHTDSAELRAALTQEWQAAVAQAPERFSRFETPVFTSTNPGSSSPGSSASDGFARQSHSHPQQAAPESVGYRAARGERFTKADGAGTAVSVDPESAPLTSRHLHTRA